MVLIALIKRHTKVYFKDKGVFISSLITPLILLFLFVTFLKNVYVDSLKMQIPPQLNLSQTLFDGFAGSWLISSLIASSCITIAFCANMVMVQDKVNGTIKDITIAPIKNSTLSLSYYISTAIVTSIVCYCAYFVGLIYLGFVGFYLSITDILLSLVDILLLVLFGTALSSLVCKFLNSQGSMSAVSTLVSTAYGFICGAYMPISQFGDGLQNTLMLFPGTYGTGLIRHHSMQGILKEFENNGLNSLQIEGIRKAFDAKLSFFGKDVNVSTMYLVIILTIITLVSAFLLINYFDNKIKRKQIIKNNKKLIENN